MTTPTWNLMYASAKGRRILVLDMPTGVNVSWLWRALMVFRMVRLSLPELWKATKQS
jgi:hypothetical protein